MSLTVAGFVTNGMVVPKAPLPEGAFVEIRVINTRIEVPPELQEEFEAWDRASGKALELSERLAQQEEGDAKEVKSGRCESPLRPGMRRPANGPP